ncbi:MAG: YitT family protein [Clostridia bacterium]|nr:YitT family protein [Clostridia bacterium]
MDKKKVLNVIVRHLIATCGCALYALGVELFLSPNNLASSGVTGIGLILENHGILSTGYWIIIFNIPLFIIGFIFLGKKMMFSTIYSTVVSSLLMELFSFLLSDKCLNIALPLTDNSLIAAVAAGILFGAGLGLVFRAHSSTGGTDIIVKILRKKFRSLKTGEIAFAVNVIIVTLGAILIENTEIAGMNEVERWIYSVISLATETLTFDYVLYGSNSAKLVYIIPGASDVETMCKHIMTEVNTGATFLNGKGAYTGTDKEVIMCVCRKAAFPKLKDIVKKEDPKAFMIVTSAKDIYGVGYQDPNADEL